MAAQAPSAGLDIPPARTHVGGVHAFPHLPYVGPASPLALQLQAQLSSESLPTVVAGSPQGVQQLEAAPFCVESYLAAWGRVAAAQGCAAVPRAPAPTSHTFLPAAAPAAPPVRSGSLSSLYVDWAAVEFEDLLPWVD